jgi:hypothetical protein
MKQPIVIGVALLLSFYCGWITPRNRYQLLHFDVAANQKQYDATRIDTWTGEIQVMMRMPEPNGGDYLCDYWVTVPNVHTEAKAIEIYNTRKKFDQMNQKK